MKTYVVEVISTLIGTNEYHNMSSWCKEQINLIYFSVEKNRTNKKQPLSGMHCIHIGRTLLFTIITVILILLLLQSTRTDITGFSKWIMLLDKTVDMKSNINTWFVTLSELQSWHLFYIFMMHRDEQEFHSLILGYLGQLMWHVTIQTWCSRSEVTR